REQVATRHLRGLRRVEVGRSFGTPGDHNHQQQTTHARRRLQVGGRGTLRATTQTWRFPMGYLSTDKKRDLSKHETLYEHPDARELLSADKKTIAVIEGGSSVEALGGLVTVVLAILGLARYDPLRMGGVAAIVIGASLFVQGGAIASRWRSELRRLDGVRYDRNELIGGVSTEVFGGVVGIVLGILVLA